MSKAQHTPGPWRVNPKVPTRVEQTNAGQGINILCRCDDLDGDRSRAEDRANAHLIAAAPDLLAALQNAVRCAERDGMPNNPGSSPKWTINARAAIAKATGGA